MYVYLRIYCTHDMLKRFPINIWVQQNDAVYQAYKFNVAVNCTSLRYHIENLFSTKPSIRFLGMFGKWCNICSTSIYVLLHKILYFTMYLCISAELYMLMCVYVCESVYPDLARCFVESERASAFCYNASLLLNLLYRFSWILIRAVFK